MCPTVCHCYRFVIVLLSSKGTLSMLSTREYILLLLSLGLAYAITLSFLLSFFLETLVSWFFCFGMRARAYTHTHNSPLRRIRVGGGRE